jgi:(p)ppGpp synthase/HD superfamily hydrolase
MTELVQKAWDFAKKAHEGVARKFSGLPYFDAHVLEVYNLVCKYGGSEEEKAAALLHDCIEDVEWITYDVIKREFGVVVADMVEELTSNEDLLNQMGKGPYLLHKMLKMSVGALKIKLCDRLCNISDLMTASEKFRVKYYKETRFIMDGLVERDLNPTHRRIVDDIEAILDEVNSYYHYDSFKPKMKYLKLYEDFKQKNITQEDIVKCIDNGGVIYADIVNNFPDNDPKEPINPVSVDDDGLVTVEIEGSNYEVDLKNVTKMEWGK